MKLYGKDLDDELAKRRQAQDERRSKKLTIRKAAELKGISASDLIAYERGDDVCPHEKYVDKVAGFPIPTFILMVCEKCGKPDENSLTKLDESNAEKLFRSYNAVMRRREKDSKEDK
jgi:transcriptional regulator with XRE-family HTH domain